MDEENELLEFLVNVGMFSLVLVAGLFEGLGVYCFFEHLGGM